MPEPSIPRRARMSSRMTVAYDVYLLPPGDSARSAGGTGAEDSLRFQPCGDCPRVPDLRSSDRQAVDVRQAKIRDACVAFEIPTGDELTGRLDGVLQTL